MGDRPCGVAAGGDNLMIRRTVGAAFPAVKARQDQPFGLPRLPA
jgi:hypothetical protein